MYTVLASEKLENYWRKPKHKGPLTNFLSCLDAALFLETVGYEKFLNYNFKWASLYYFCSDTVP